MKKSLAKRSLSVFVGIVLVLTLMTIDNSVLAANSTVSSQIIDPGFEEVTDVNYSNGVSEITPEYKNIPKFELLDEDTIIIEEDYSLGFGYGDGYSFIEWVINKPEALSIRVHFLGITPYEGHVSTSAGDTWIHGSDTWSSWSRGSSISIYYHDSPLDYTNVRVDKIEYVCNIPVPEPIEPAPTGIEITPSFDRIAISWDAVLGATGYDIEKDGIVIDTVVGTTYIHSDLTLNKNSIYRVRANRLGKWSEPISISNASEGLIISKGIDILYKAPLIDHFSERISISRPEATKIRVHFSEVYATCECEIYTDLGDYWWCEYSKNIWSEWSSGNSIEVVISQYSNVSQQSYFHIDKVEYISQLPDSPKVSSSATENEIILIWDPILNAIGYDVERNGFIINNGVNTTFIHSGLSPNSQERYRIRARYAEGTGYWFATCVKSTLPRIPIFSDWGEITSNSASLNWINNGNPQNTEYRVILKELNTGEIVSDSDWHPTIRAWTFTGLIKGNFYQCWIKARNNDKDETVWVDYGSICTLDRITLNYYYNVNNQLEYIYLNDIPFIQFIYDSNGNLISKRKL